jgi:hypothetical protein
MYEWLSRLAPFLTGEHTLPDLVGPLASEQRTMVGDLVRVLSERRFVVDVGREEPHLLDELEQRVYAAEIVFIGYAADSARWRFQRVRQARVTVTGEGPVLSALLAAGMRSGWREVRLLAPAGEIDVLRGEAERARRDPNQSVCFEAVSGQPDYPELAAGADVVLQVCGMGSHTDLVELAQCCAETGTALGQVGVGAGEAWLTEVGGPDAESCWRRLRGAPEGDIDRDWLTGPVPHVVAGQLALSCFSYLTGLNELPPQPELPVLTRVDLVTLVTRRHRVLPHPLVGKPSRPDVRASLDTLPGVARIDPGELLANAGRYIDSRTGLLGILDEEELPQLPLSLCRAGVSDPYGLLPAWAPVISLTGWGADRAAARVRALLAALACYSLLTPGPDSTWGLDLATGEHRPVPAGLVAASSGIPYRRPIGVAAGLSWADAVAAGLREHCEALVATQSEGQPVAAAELAWLLDEDERATNLWRLLRAAGQSLKVTEATETLGLPSFVLRAGTAPPTYSCATSRPEALREGLERALVRWQCDRSDLEPTAWPGDAEPGDAEPGDQTSGVLGAALRRAGWRPVAVPIGHDRLARELLPFTVRVVLCDD